MRKQDQVASYGALSGRRNDACFRVSKTILLMIVGPIPLCAHRCQSYFVRMRRRSHSGQVIAAIHPILEEAHDEHSHYSMQSVTSFSVGLCITGLKAHAVRSRPQLNKCRCLRGRQPSKWQNAPKDPHNAQLWTHLEHGDIPARRC